MKDDVKNKLMEFAKTHPHFVQIVETKPNNFTPKTKFTPNTLNTVISESTAINQEFIDTAIFPIIVEGGTVQNPTVVTFSENLTLHTTDSYFIVNSNYIIFDGLDHEVHFDIPMDGFESFVMYGSLIQNGTGDDGVGNDDAFDYICIKNIKIILDYAVDWYLFPNMTPFQEGGWLTAAYFGLGRTHNTIKNVCTNGDAINGSGALVGNYSTVTICESYSTGLIGFALLQILLNQDLNGLGFAGGVIGSYCVNCNVSNCFSAGRIGILSGGITGAFCDGLTITDCYALGDVFVLAGGIVGAGTTNTTVTNCYSNQYITVYSGSIYAFGCTESSAENCYTSAIFTDCLPRIFALGDDDTQLVLHCYTYCSSWNNETADSILVNKCGKVYTRIGCNSYPYLLTTFDKHNYLVNKKEVKSGCLKHSEAGRFEHANYMILSINGKNKDEFPKIWIDANTGVLTFDRIKYEKCAHKYMIKVLSYKLSGGSYFNYHISDYELNVTKC